MIVKGRSGLFRFSLEFSSIIKHNDRFYVKCICGSDKRQITDSQVLLDLLKIIKNLAGAIPVRLPSGQCVHYHILKGGFPVMAEITRILAANIHGQLFFVITTAASTRCLVQNFQLSCYLQRVNATSQYNDSGSSRCSKWPNDRLVAVVKYCRLIVQERRSCRER